MLSNPRYVLDLVDRGFFGDKNFMEYIEKLKCFFEDPKLFRLVKYPEGLYNLRTMLNKGFEYSLREKVNRNKFILCCLRRNEEIRAKSSVITFSRFQSLENE